MIIQAGKREIKDNLYSLGPAELPVYLVDGENPALFDAGVSILGEYYVDRIREILGGRTLKYLFLSHVHFDHCGATGLIKQAYPDVVVCASGISAEIIGKPSALTLIGKLNALPGSSATQLFIPFTINRILREGEKLRLGNQLTVEVISAPGHTRDLLAYYIPERRTLIPS
jgi:glyoxylase-like metal-dependent hydrolase (beta-lactamase superfamily II)